MAISFTKQILLAILVLFYSTSFGQKDVHLVINQSIGNVPFSIGDGGTNDLGTKFNISRLDYYISSIILHHDGGMKTNVSNKYVFVSKGKIVDELLGSFDIGVLDSITFSVGVEETDNHADPTLWPSTHPLAPKSPEMHWGWAAGFRFVAIEGKSGANLQFNYQIHGLGDELYRPTTIITNGIDHDGALMISIDADYKHSFKGINMNKNVILHGSTKEAISLMGNYNNHIFKATEAISASHDIEIGTLKIYPNPVVGGRVVISLTDDQVLNSQLTVKDVVGRTIYQSHTPSMQNEIWVEAAGFYTVELVQAGKVVYRGSIIKP